VLDVEGLQVRYGQVTAVWSVSVTVASGELVAVIGPNGAGKTTLVNAVAGLIPAGQGRIHFLGRDVTLLPSHRRAALGLCLCPEGRKLFPDMTVEENLRLGAYTCRHRVEANGRLGKVFALFPQLAARRAQLARTLSGGEQQMVALGRALMARPQLLLLDEPSLGLAPIVVAELFRAVREIHEAGTTVLMVEQNVRQTLEIADRGYVIETGRIALTGTGEALLADAHMREAYLGLGGVGP
jgi:branched-chain amino acid transport system ATP-binding protein